MDKIDLFSISVDLVTKSFTVQGTERFVKEESRALFDALKNLELYTQNEDIRVPVTDKDDKSSKNQSQIMNTNTDKFFDEGILHFDAANERVDILADLIGSNPEKTCKIGCILALCNENKSIGKDEIIRVAEKHGCYDQSNFAKRFSKEKTLFLKKGEKNDWYIVLTRPGEKYAISVLEEMLKNAE